MSKPSFSQEISPCELVIMYDEKDPSTYKTIRLYVGDNEIGKSNSCDIRIPQSPFIDEKQAIINIEQQGIYSIENLSDKQPMFKETNGSQKMPLRPRKVYDLSGSSNTIIYFNQLKCLFRERKSSSSEEKQPKSKQIEEDDIEYIEPGISLSNGQILKSHKKAFRKKDQAHENQINMNLTTMKVPAKNPPPENVRALSAKTSLVFQSEVQLPQESKKQQTVVKRKQKIELEEESDSNSEKEEEFMPQKEQPKKAARPTAKKLKIESSQSSGVDIRELEKQRKKGDKILKNLQKEINTKAQELKLSDKKYKEKLLKRQLSQEDEEEEDPAKKLPNTQEFITTSLIDRIIHKYTDSPAKQAEEPKAASTRRVRVSSSKDTALEAEPQRASLRHKIEAPVLKESEKSEIRPQLEPRQSLRGRIASKQSENEEPRLPEVTTEPEDPKNRASLRGKKGPAERRDAILSAGEQENLKEKKAPQKNEPVPSGEKNGGKKDPELSRVPAPAEKPARGKAAKSSDKNEKVDQPQAPKNKPAKKDPSPSSDETPSQSSDSEESSFEEQPPTKKGRQQAKKAPAKKPESKKEEKTPLAKKKNQPASKGKKSTAESENQDSASSESETSSSDEDLPVQKKQAVRKSEVQDSASSESETSSSDEDLPVQKKQPARGRNLANQKDQAKDGKLAGENRSEVRARSRTNEKSNGDTKKKGASRELKGLQQTSKVLPKRNQYRVLLSNCSATAQDKTALQKLGCKFVEDSDKNFNVLVMDSYRRRVKLMMALNRCAEIVSTKWIGDSLKQGELLPLDKYYLKTGDKSINLEQSINRALTRDKNTLEGFDFHIPEDGGFEVSQEELQQLIETAGGTVNPLLGRETLLVINEKNEKAKFEYVNGHNTVYSQEIIFQSILLQQPPQKKDFLLEAGKKRSSTAAKNQNI